MRSFDVVVPHRFRATLEFPKDFPVMPPAMTFRTKMWHPNIYPDGRVCISILHAPGDDPLGYELSNERWSPVRSVEKVHRIGNLATLQNV